MNHLVILNPKQRQKRARNDHAACQHALRIAKDELQKGLHV